MKKTSQSAHEKSVGIKLPGYWTFFRNTTPRRSVRDIRESLESGNTKTPADVPNGSVNPDLKINAETQESEPESRNTIESNISSKQEITGVTNSDEKKKQDGYSVTKLRERETIPTDSSNSGTLRNIQNDLEDQKNTIYPITVNSHKTSEIIPKDLTRIEYKDKTKNSVIVEDRKGNAENFEPSRENEVNDTVIDSDQNKSAQERLEKSQSVIENLQHNLATQVSSETKEAYKESIAKNQISSQGVNEKQESEPQAKPVRVSWTTRLIQKLTEEEETKKKIRQEPKVQKPKRIVRFPQKKPPKSENKEWPKFYPGIKKPEVQTERKKNVSGIKLDNTEKDAYASLITQLADPEDKKKTTVEEKDEAQLQKVEEIRAALAREEYVTSSDDDSVVDMKEKPTGIRRLLPQNLFSRKEENERPVLEPLLKRGDRIYPTRPVHETAFLSRSQSSSPARDNEHNTSRSKSMSPARNRRTVPDAPLNAYYHSPPSRRKISEASSASSSSTLVAENWNPMLVNLEHQAISGSPDIRRLQQHKHYGEIRRNGNQGLLQVQVPTGRLSAPPYHGDDYPKCRLTTPELPRSSRRSSSQPPRQKNSLQSVAPVSAQVKITTSSRDANSKETQTNRSYIHQQCQDKHLQSQPSQNKQMSPEQYQKNRHYQNSSGVLHRSLSPVQPVLKQYPSGNQHIQHKHSPSQPENYPSDQRSLSSTDSLNRQYQKNPPQVIPDDFNRQYQNIPAQFQRSLTPVDSVNRHQHSNSALKHIQQQSKQSPQHLNRSLSPIRYHNSPVQLHRSLSPAESLNRQQLHSRSGSQQLQHQNKHSPQHLDRSLSPVCYQNSPTQLQRSLSPAKSLNREHQHSHSGSKQLHSPQQLYRSLSPVRYDNSPEQFQRSLSPAASLNRAQTNQIQVSPGTLNRQHHDNIIQNNPQVLNRQYQNSPVQFGPQTLNRQYQNIPAQPSVYALNRQHESSASLQSNQSPVDALNRQYHMNPEQQSTEALNRQYQKIPAQHSTDSLNRLFEDVNRQHQSRPYKKLSRQEVEALYWETQKLRAGLSSLSQQLNMSTASLQTPPVVPRPAYRVHSAQNVGSGYGSLLVKPQPMTPRARSVSPSPDRHLNTRSLSLPRDTNFSRGTPMRNTIGPIRTQPPIYEETEEVLLRHGNKGGKKKSNYAPIFKRGSLTCPAEDTGSSQYPKRVSFTSSGEQLYWPTRNGPAPEPPTRQRKSTTDSDEYNTYANIPATMTAPNRPLPPVPRERSVVVTPNSQRWQQQSESESGSEAGEVQRILQQGSQGRGSYYRFPEEEWGADGKARGTPGTEQSVSNVGRDDEVRRSGGGGGRSGRRDEPRRHTLSGDHHHHQQGGALARSMDLEMSSKSQRRKSPLPRGYPPPSSAMLFDDDPGIMSEVETSSTGFRRGGKQRSSLPVVRTPSKTLERPLGKTSGAGMPIGVGPMLRISQQMVPPHHHGLPNKQSASSGGLVFLQYRNETKRALLPNEITSIDTVKALFVRSFPKQLTMEYLDSPHVKIYIHDSSKDMFYELEDLRSHLRDIRDRSVLRLFESTDMNGGVLPGAGVGVVAPPMWDQDQSYFSEPEFDSEYQHQHIHKTKAHLMVGDIARLSNTIDSGIVRKVSKVIASMRGSYTTFPSVKEYPKIQEFYAVYHFPRILDAVDCAHVKILSPGGNGVEASSKSGSSGVPPQAPYYMTHSYPPGGATGAPGASATLPRGGPLLRAYSPAVAPPVPADRIKTLPQTDRLHAESGYMSSPERGGPRAYPSAAYPPGGPGYEDPYYSQYASRSGSITPVIDEEASDTELIDESYSLYGVKLPTAGRSIVTPQPRGQFPAPAVVPYDATRIRVEHMERQLANLTGLVQKALTQTPTPREYLQVPPPPASTRDTNYRNAATDEYDKHSSSSSASLPDDSYLRTDTKPPKLGKDKSVSFEKSVSFSDEPPDMNSPKQHSPQHAADSKPPKPAIKSSTLPRMSSQERTERDRHKPAPPPKPVSLSPGQYEGRHVYRDLQLTPEMYNQLRGLQKKAKDLRQEVRNLRRMSQAQAHSVRETIRDTFMKIRAVLLMGGEESWALAGDADKVRLNREEDTYKQEMLRLEKDLTELESTVEELRGNVINRKTRVNMSDVENMALILSKSSKTVADLKVRFPGLQEGMKGLLASEMEKVVREEKFLKEEPERLESALRRCKKLTGTLVTLKRLASVQEQRLPPSATPESRLSPTMGMGGDSDTPITPPAHGKPGAIPARSIMAPSIGSDGTISRQRPENALDALLDELQTFARPPSRGHNPPMADIGRKGSIDSAHTLPSSTGTSSLRRLHSYPSSSDGGGNSPPTVALSRLQVSGSTSDAPKSPATSPKPPVPERNSELLSHLAGRRVPPPPPPRTSSRSPLASPTSPSLPPRGQPQMGIGGGTLLRRGGPGRSSLREPLRTTPAVKQEESAQQQPGFNPASNSSSCESINSQEGLQNKPATTTSAGNKARQEILEQRHQELLRKQRALQEQYARLQQLQRGGGGSLAVVPPPDLLLKKTGSESNLLAKMGLGHGLSAAAPISGSLTHLAAVANQQLIVSPKQMAPSTTASATTTTTVTATTTTTTTNKIYETDIL